MRMIRILSVAVVLGLVASPALADYYGGATYYSRIGGYYSGNGGEFTLADDGWAGTLLISNSAYAAATRGQDGNAESFQTFCVEATEYVAQPMDIMVSTTSTLGGLGSHAIQGGTPPLGDDLDPRTAFLYTKFATGTFAAADYNYTVGVNRQNSALALQQAIWWIEGEAGGVNNSLVTLADTAVAFGGEWYLMGIGDVRVLNMYTPGFPGDPGHLQQDQLWLIPAPGAALLGVIGLGVVGWVKRRFS